MTIRRAVNALLSPLNIAVCKRSTIDGLHADLERLQEKPPATNETNCGLGCSERELIRLQIDGVRRDIVRHQIATKWATIDTTMRLAPLVDASRVCPICGHKAEEDAFIKYESHCIFGGGHLLRRKCPECDVIFGGDKMFQLTRKELENDYEWHYQVYEEGDSTEQELSAFYNLNPKREGIYLNYGAGSWSRTVDILRADGWNVLGFEPHGSATPHRDYMLTSYSELAGRNFDGIFSNNVLEHLRYPVEELKFMRDRLTQKGKMSHATPCFEYLYEYTRFHLFFFLGQSRNVIAEQAGLRIEDFVVDGEFMNLILSSKK